MLTKEFAFSATFYQILQVRDISDYSMENRTYRYSQRQPLYPFGFGLSYSHFEYSNLDILPKIIAVPEIVRIAVSVTNRGPYDADEV